MRGFWRHWATALEIDGALTWTGDRPEAFVEALRQLEGIRNEFFSLSAAERPGTFTSMTP